MAATKYESKIGQIPYNDQVVYAVLSNLENLNRFSNLIPKDKVKELDSFMSICAMPTRCLALLLGYDTLLMYSKMTSGVASAMASAVG